MNMRLRITPIPMLFSLFFSISTCSKKVGSHLLDSSGFICICICMKTPPNFSCYVLAKIVFTHKQASPWQLNKSAIYQLIQYTDLNR